MSADLRLLLAEPSRIAPLDPGFRPVALGNRRYLAEVQRSGKGRPLALALERDHGLVSLFTTEVRDDGAELDADTRAYTERLLKFLLWQKGGWKLTVAGPKAIADHLRDTYRVGGARAFDADIVRKVYDQDFVVEHAPDGVLPAERESASPLGGHLDGCRIGFDLGASDYKISAVKEGTVVFTTELPWDPSVQKDPEYHYAKIREGLKLAASKLPRVDAIGGSTAGIVVANEIKVASLFRAVPHDLFAAKARPIFLNLAKEWGVPFEVANDGDVTALAGGLSLRENAVLGVAMGSSEAGGWLDPQGRITGWLNELAFCPVDYSPQAAADPWSGDRGCGALYFSQQAVVKLAPAAEIALPQAHPAEQLKRVQDLHTNGDPRAAKIFETIGVYLGHAMALYADMYDYRHLLILGRVTSGCGGDLIVEHARQALAADYPEIAERVQVSLPDEKSKRVGQAVAAASLPKRRGENASAKP
ncbi:MAG: ROK family protein [Verrucomicrobiae bacterium]|nr:ROK family protein [Verrucomicrobiae bacterium]